MSYGEKKRCQERLSHNFSNERAITFWLFHAASSEMLVAVSMKCIFVKDI